MSHFIGLVFVPGDNDLDTMLLPYDEQTEDPDYLEFEDCTQEVKDLFAKLPDTLPSEGKFQELIDRTEEVQKIWKEAPDQLSEEQEKAFWKPYNKKDYPTPSDIAKDKEYIITPDESKEGGFRFEQEVERDYKYEPTKEKYPTIGQLAKDYFGYHKRTLDGEVQYGYTHNPQAKWDWYVKGGRWSGYIFKKEGGTTDYAMLTEVDWDKMFQKDEEGYDHIPFCFVDREGSWHEKGEMGWWAMVSNEKKKDDWHGEFKEYVLSLVEEEANLPEEERTTVYAIDFHI